MGTVWHSGWIAGKVVPAMIGHISILASAKNPVTGNSLHVTGVHSASVKRTGFILRTRSVFPAPKGRMHDADGMV